MSDNREAAGRRISLIQELLAIMKQAAIETGQWVEKRSEKVSVDMEIRARLESARTRLQAAGIPIVIPAADEELPPIPPPLGLPPGTS